MNKKDKEIEIKKILVLISSVTISPIKPPESLANTIMIVGTGMMSSKFGKDIPSFEKAMSHFYLSSEGGFEKLLREMEHDLREVLHGCVFTKAQPEESSLDFIVKINILTSGILVLQSVERIIQKSPDVFSA